MTSDLPQTYARATGAVLLTLGVGLALAMQMGFVGFLSLAFHAFDQVLNGLHIVLGAVGLYVGFAARPALSPAAYARGFGALYLALGLLGFLAAAAFAPLGIGLELGENALHLVLGAAGLAAGFARTSPGTIPWEPSRAAPPRPAPVLPLEVEAAAPLRYPPPYKAHEPIEAVEGIGATFGQKLRAIGIVEQDDLLPRDPEVMAEETGIQAALVRKWHAQVQLAAVNGIGPQFGELLVRAGVEGLASLAAQTPAALARKVAEYEASLDVSVQGRTITKEMCADWIKQARAFVKKGIPASPGSVTRAPAA